MLTSQLPFRIEFQMDSRGKVLRSSRDLEDLKDEDRERFSIKRRTIKLSNGAIYEMTYDETTKVISPFSRTRNIRYITYERKQP